METITPAGFRFVFDGECGRGGCAGAVCSSEAEARQSLIEEMLKLSNLSYQYREGLCTGSPVPCPPPGFQTVVVHGFDHHENFYEEFFAITLGQHLQPMYDDQEFEVVETAGCLWTSWWEENTIILPPGSLQFRAKGYYYEEESDGRMHRKTQEESAWVPANCNCLEE